jgi:hypothetical protein
MALVVEDGSGVPGANTYVSEAVYQAYLADRGLPASVGAEGFLRRSMDVIEAIEWCGRRADDNQDTSWPRISLTHPGVRNIQPDEIPVEVISAQCALTAEIEAGNDPGAYQGRTVKREKVDVLEVEYMDGAKNRLTVADLPSVWRWISRLVCSAPAYIDRA